MENTFHQKDAREDTFINKLLRYIALAGNIVFVLWMLVNAIDEGFSGAGIVELVSMISLVFLLTLNTFLLCRSPQSNVSRK